MAATPLSGTPFGTAGAWAGSSNTFDKALDNNPATYFDAPTANGVTLGYDLGTAKPLSSVRFTPRPDLAWRMTGGQFQGSNDNANWTTLATIATQPADGQTSTLAVSNTTPFRYVRYAAPANSFGNVADVQFLTDAATPVTTPVTTPTTGALTGTPTGTPGAWAGSANTFDKALDGNPSTYFDAPISDNAFVALDLGSTKTLSSVRYFPRTGLAWRMAGGTFQGSNDNANWTTLATVTATPADGQYNTLPIGDPSAYRYVRYVSPRSGFGNVAEIEFHGTNPNPAPPPTQPPAVSDPVGVAAPVPVLTLMQARVTAGTSVHAHATDTVLNSGSPVTARYEWDFGDPNSKYNNLVGFNAAHAYDAPGTYTVTLRVTNEAGAAATVSRQVTVAADARRTIYVDSASGNDAGTGTSPSAAVRSAARAFQLLGPDTRILFQRGQDFPVTDFLNATHSNVTIGAYGSGANPTLRWHGPADEWYEVISAGGATTRDVTVENLTIASATGRTTGIAARGHNVTIRNCTFRDLSTAITAAGNPAGLLVQDNVQPANAGITDYFLWLQGADAVVLGNSVAAGAMYAIRTSGGTGESVTRALFARNNLASADRSNLRIQKGSYCYVVNNAITHSGVEFGPLGGGDGFADPHWSTARSQFDVFESNTFTAAPGKYLRISSGTEHVSVRNNVIRADDQQAIAIEGYDAAFNRQVVDAYVLNNTVINNGTGGQFLNLVSPGLNPQVTLENNLYVAPSLAVGLNGAAPIYVHGTDLSTFRLIQDNVWSLPGSTNAWANGGINFISPTFALPGYVTPTNWEAFPQVDHDTFASTPLTSTLAPTGVAATHSRPAPGVFTDFSGKARPTFSNWSAGAIQA
jgi:hypothetical protein